MDGDVRRRVEWGEAGQAGKQRDWAAYVFVVNRPDLLKRALDCFPDLWDDCTIIDNSQDGIPVLDLTWPSDRPSYTDFPRFYRPPVPLTYSQSMNWMLADAQRKNRTLIAHFHSDTFSTNPDAVSQLLTRARADLAEGRRVCCWYTLHDLLWIINTAALADIGGCDTHFHDYFTDGDLRMRWELAGWTRVNSGVEGISHEGSATINSDPKLQFINSRTFNFYGALYAAKWGGGPGEERFTHPWNNPALDLRP